MITITQNRNGFNIQGHAGYAEFGKDIVCAGVSALLQGLLVSFDHLTDDRITSDISPGRADIYYRNLSKTGRLLMDSFFLGVLEIEKEFPEYVKIIDRNCR